MSAQYYLYGREKSARAAVMRPGPGAGSISVVSVTMAEPIISLVQKYGPREVALLALTGSCKTHYSRELSGLTLPEVNAILDRWMKKQGKEHFTKYL